jgi:hypothetical protein
MPFLPYTRATFVVEQAGHSSMAYKNEAQNGSYFWEQEDNEIDPQAGSHKASSGLSHRTPENNWQDIIGELAPFQDQDYKDLHAGAIGAPATFESSVRKRSEEILTPAQRERCYLRLSHVTTTFPQLRNGDSPVSYSDQQPWGRRAGTVESEETVTAGQQHSKHLPPAVYAYATEELQGHC